MALEIYEEIEANLYRIEKQVKEVDESTLASVLDCFNYLETLEKKVGFYSGIPYPYILRKQMSKQGRIEYLQKLDFTKYINRTYRKISRYTRELL